MPRTRKPRRAAWGSLSYDAKTRTARIRYWASTPQGYRRCSKTFRDVSRAEAEERRAALMLDHSHDAPCPTVRESWERWVVPEMEQRRADGTLSKRSMTQYTSTWHKHVEPFWGDIPCDMVRPLQVQQWLSQMGLSAATSALGVLSKPLDYAVRYEYVPHNVTREKYLMPPKSTVSKRDDGVWSLDELGEAWRSLFGSWLEPAFIIAAFGGARVGESLAPLAGEVELRDVGGVPVAVVPIVRQVPNRGKVGEVVDELKTEDSTRVIVIPGRAALRLASIAESLPPDCPLTHDGFGRHQPQHRLFSAWTKLDMAHPFKNLRNSWQTNCRWTLKMPPWITEKMMGHKGTDVTAVHYDRPAADTFAEYIAQAYRETPYDADWTWADGTN